MQKIQDIISKNLAEHTEKVEKMVTLQSALNWFLTHYDKVEFDHKDIRGGNVTPVIILSGHCGIIDLPNALQHSFENHKDYEKFKKYKLTIGFATHTNDKTYFYIGCNDVLDYSLEEAKDLLYRRVNKEMFPHIEKYFA